MRVKIAFMINPRNAVECGDCDQGLSGLCEFFLKERQMGASIPGTKGSREPLRLSECIAAERFAQEGA